MKMLDTIISPGEFIAWQAILQSIYKWSLGLMEMENESASDACEAKSLNWQLSYTVFGLSKCF
jgi:hypothetical protein